MPNNKIREKEVTLEATVLCDNLHVYNTKDTYEAEGLAEKYINNKNVDAHLLAQE